MQTTTTGTSLPHARSADAAPRPYQQCTIGILDTIDDPGITFDERGICNYYYDYLKQAESLPRGAERDRRFRESIDAIRKAGKGRPYDCILGLSGGVDSSYLALIAREQGLRPLAVHFDNGWNSELAVNNIENIVSKTGFDLYTYVINWEEFRDLQLAYLRASVVDIEAITDHAIFASLFRLAGKHRIKHILSGFNVVTEAVLPRHWIYNKYDHVNIRAIHREFGTTPLKTFPFMDLWVKKYYQTIRGLRFDRILDLVSYNKADAKRRIQEELGWRDYGGKHYESVWTRFYQGYILPEKFEIDKRKAHLTNLIFSGQITRDEALEEMKKPGYDPEQRKIDKEFVLKKLGLSAGEFDAIMALPPRPHSDFDMEQSMFAMHPWLRPLRPFVHLGRRLTGDR